MNENLKIEAARAALHEVRSGMSLGLGTGTTAAEFVKLLAEALRTGALRDIRSTCTSEKTEELAQSLGVPTFPLSEIVPLDLAVDGADEIDSQLRLIKGRGGALLREKIVAAASRRMIVIADASKRVKRLGRFPLPIEVVPFGLGATGRAVATAFERLGCVGELRLRGSDEAPFVTDGGHYILDAHLNAIADPNGLAAALNVIPGVVEHGLFIGLATSAILSTDDGVVVLGQL